MTSDLLTSHEVAAYIGLSYPRTVALLGGAIPSSKVGRRWMTRRIDIDSWLTANRTTRKVEVRRGRGRRTRGGTA